MPLQCTHGCSASTKDANTCNSAGPISENSALGSCLAAWSCIGTSLISRDPTCKLPCCRLHTGRCKKRDNYRMGRLLEVRSDFVLTVTSKLRRIFLPEKQRYWVTSIPLVCSRPKYGQLHARGVAVEFRSGSSDGLYSFRFESEIHHSAGKGHLHGTSSSSAFLRSFFRLSLISSPDACRRCRKP